MSYSELALCVCLTEYYSISKLKIYEYFAQDKIAETGLLKSFSIIPVTLVGRERLVKDEDQSLVIRPKYYVPSTGSAWASDFLRLRYENPKLFEMTCNGREFSDQFRRAMAIVNDCLCFISLTEQPRMI